jgi:signal peptidase II
MCDGGFIVVCGGRMSRKYWILLIVAPSIFILDQATKWWVVENIVWGEGFAVIPEFFDMVHVKNRGAAFGLFAGANAQWREPFFYVISSVAMGAIGFFLRQCHTQERLMPLTLSLILGGVLGNLLDRIRLGAVTDFVSVHWRDVVVDWHFVGLHVHFPLNWPAFNVADSAITVSMLLLAWQLMKTPFPTKGA